MKGGFMKPIISGPYRTFRRLNQEETFIEFEGSTITIPMKGRRSAGDPWLEDEIKLKAFMRLEIYPPYVNNLGTREFQFIIRDWDLYGKSPMLNQLFFDDPRGRLVVDKDTGLADYASAFVTFNVSHNYHIGVEEGFEGFVSQVFGSERDIEIRNLTSHHLRVWAPYQEREGSRWFYTHPNNKIYWQICPAKLRDKKELRYLFGDGRPSSGCPVMIFHKKPPRIPGESDLFDISSPSDRARYLLAIAEIHPEGKGKQLCLNARLPSRGFEGNKTQLRGNAVLSSLYRPRQDLEIRWKLDSKLNGLADFEDAFGKSLAKSKKTAINGWIQIVSPSRSLGTADQAPDVGNPVDSTDFPARITYAINYNIFINKERFVEDQSGIAIAVGAVEVPPRDVTVAFDKPHVGHVLKSFLEFGPGHCTGMHEITTEEYHEGLNFARYARTIPLDNADAAAWDAFEDFDPTITY
jgi:hypothetical protein